MKYIYPPLTQYLKLVTFWNVGARPWICGGPGLFFEQSEDSEIWPWHCRKHSAIYSTQFEFWGLKLLVYSIETSEVVFLNCILSGFQLKLLLETWWPICSWRLTVCLSDQIEFISVTEFFMRDARCWTMLFCAHSGLSEVMHTPCCVQLQRFARVNCSKSDGKFDSVKVRIYLPVTYGHNDDDAVRPGVAYYHGGGWVRGMLGRSSSYSCCSTFSV